METAQEIKRLLKLSEIAQAKIIFNHNGTRVINPMQQSAVTRLVNKAYKLQGNLSSFEMINIHRDAIKELKDENAN